MNRNDQYRDNHHQAPRWTLSRKVSSSSSCEESATEAALGTFAAWERLSSSSSSGATATASTASLSSSSSHHHHPGLGTSSRHSHHHHHDHLQQSSRAASFASSSASAGAAFARDVVPDPVSSLRSSAPPSSPPPPLSPRSPRSPKSPRATMTRKPSSAAARQMLLRRKSSGLRDELGSLVAELQLSSSRPSSPRSRSRSSSIVEGSPSCPIVPDGCNSSTRPGPDQQQQRRQHQHQQEGAGPERRPARTPDPETLRRERFLIFVRILFKCLDGPPPSSSCSKEAGTGKTMTGCSPQLRLSAKRVVRECTAKNRAGVPGYSPLVDVLEERLRELGGKDGEMACHWRRAEGYMRQYLAMRRAKLSGGRAGGRRAVAALGMTKGAPTPAASPPALVAPAGDEGGLSHVHAVGGAQVVAQQQQQCPCPIPVPSPPTEV